jgi:hypothetical protein
MEHIQSMTWQTFKALLQDHTESHLQFEYDNGKWVDASYHLTEIKQAPITSVDCGGKMNAWTEVVLQLWEPSNKEERIAMQVKKALSIIDIVERAMPVNPLAIVKIEYGNEQFAMRQLQPIDIELNDNNLNISLSAGQTECKAIGRGDTCGTPKKKIELSILTPEANSCCTPESGCC